MQEVVPTRGEAVQKPSRCEADAAVGRVRGNHEAVAGDDFELLAVEVKAEPAALDEGGLHVGMAVQGALRAFFEAEGHPP